VHSQELAKQTRGAGSNGIVFDSVRKPLAENIAVFRPSILAAAPGKAHVIQTSHISVEWDGTRMSRYIVMGELEWKTL
jgi:hypothetical protein